MKVETHRIKLNEIMTAGPTNSKPNVKCCWYFHVRQL